MSATTPPVSDETLDVRELLKGASIGWKVSLTDDTMVIDADRNEVACAAGDYNDPDLWPIMEANARLIAAAPTLAREVLAMREENRVLREALDFAEAEARRIAGGYSWMSDGRNTFTIFADRLAALKASS